VGIDPNSEQQTDLNIGSGVGVGAIVAIAGSIGVALGLIATGPVTASVIGVLSLAGFAVGYFGVGPTFGAERPGVNFDTDTDQVSNMLSGAPVPFGDDTQNLGRLAPGEFNDNSSLLPVDNGPSRFDAVAEAVPYLSEAAQTVAAVQQQMPPADIVAQDFEALQQTYIAINSLATTDVGAQDLVAVEQNNTRLAPLAGGGQRDSYPAQVTGAEPPVESQPLPPPPGPFPGPFDDTPMPGVPTNPDLQATPDTIDPGIIVQAPEPYIDLRMPQPETSPYDPTQNLPPVYKDTGYTPEDNALQQGEWSLPAFTDPATQIPSVAPMLPDSLTSTLSSDLFNPTPLTSNLSGFTQGALSQSPAGTFTTTENSPPSGSGSGYDYGGGGYGGYGGYGYPVILDLTGKGINIKQLSSSNTFFDMAGDGKQHLTAWAGPGNGVLFFDPTGAGQLTQANQMIFTDWDPTATSDMQALLDVFDTNHDGSLDAGDASFSDFFVMETNPDGTQTAHSLASLGITSINLNADATNIALPDGSSIDGETTYTTPSGSGTAATVTLASDPIGHPVTTTSTTNPDGSVTIANTAENSDGSVAYQRILNTLVSSTTSSGVTTTTTNAVLSTVNNGGVVETLQTDSTVSSTNGSSTETVTNFLGGAITSTGELTSIGTSGFEKLNSTATTRVASGGTVTTTILRDQTGGGWTSQKEVDTASGPGSGTYVVSNVNPDGSVSDVTSTTVTSGGLLRTTQNLIDGNSAMATTSVDSTVVGSSGTRTETVTDSAGSTVTSQIQTVTSTTSNTVTRTTSADLTDGSTLDLTTVDATVTSSGGASTTTHADYAANGTELDQTVTTNTPQSSGGLVTSTTRSVLDNGAFVSAGSTTTTISNAGGSATTTVVNHSPNGTLLAESITSSMLGSPARTVTTYANGDGSVSQYETVTVSSGTTTDTLENLNGDGSLAGEVVATTASGGLAKTIEIDATGSGTVSAPVFDHITSDSTVTSGGASVETVTDYGASTSYKLDQTQTSVSANGLTTTVASAFTSATLANPGTWDRITTDQTTVNGDNSLAETITTTDGSGHTLETVQKNTSANRQSVTATTTLGTTNLVKQVETVTTQSNGTVADQVVDFDQQGDVNNATVTTTSADGLVTTVQQDVSGQSAAQYASSGLAFDRTTTDTTAINSDGSRTETTNVTSQNGTLLSTATVATSPNGLTTTTTLNPYATAHYATKTKDATTLNSDGSTTETISDTSYDGTPIDSTQAITGAGGLSTTVVRDLNGDGITDQSSTDAVTLNADGSQTEVVTDYTGGTTGTVRDVTTTSSGIIVSGAGLETSITRQSNGSVPVYQTETIVPSASGTTTDTTKYYTSSGGALLLQTTDTASANGLVKTYGTAVNGDTTTDFSTTDSTVLNADGSQTETVANSNRSGLISETVTTTSANGLSRTTQVDANGAVSGGAPVFNQTTTDNTVLNSSDGSTTRTITVGNQNGATIEKSVANTSADQQTITTNRYLNETGNVANVDQSETAQTQADGSVVDTVTSYNTSGALLGTIVKTVSGNGLSKTTTYQNASGQTVDTQSDTTTFDANGDGGNLLDLEDTDVINGSTTLKSSVKTQTSGNAQTKAITTVLTGALASTNASSFNVTTNDSTSISDAGVTTETIADTINSAPSVSDTTTIVTPANKLTTTTSTTLGSAASPYIVQVNATNLDGSKSDVTTYYNPAALSVIENQMTINASWDGRTVTTTTKSDLDTTGKYNVVTDTYVKNANGTTTETRSGTGSFGAPAFSQTVNTVANADASETTTTLNYDQTGALIGQTVADAAPDGLDTSFAYDTTGRETIANLDNAAADILSGVALPSLLGTDIIGSDATTLNPDGSKTEVVETAYGNSFTNLRSETVKTTSANGLVTTTKIDNNGNGVFNQIDTATTYPDGSQYDVYNYYGDTSAAANTLVGQNVYNVSANGLVSTLETSTGIIDTTVHFPNSNGSYEWSRTVAPNSPASDYTRTLAPGVPASWYGNGYQGASASHFVDANGIDTWSFYDGTGDPPTTITIDLATEQQDIGIADQIYQTLLGHPMDDAETQSLANYITNGVLNEYQFAWDTIAWSPEYADNYYGLTLGYSNGYPVFSYDGFDVTAAFENALGRLPTAEEMAVFGGYLEDAQPWVSDVANMVVAVAQYAADQGGGNNRTSIDPNQDLVNTAPQWISPASGLINVSAGTYSSSGKFFVDGNASTGTGGVTATIDGNNDVILALGGANITVSGFNDSIDDAHESVTANASNAALMVENGGILTAAGSNDQIAQVGPSELILTSGSGNTIYVESGTLLSGYPYTSSSPITSASNASITFGAGVVGTVYGNNDTVNVGANSFVTVSGTGNTIDVTGGGTALVNGTASGSIVSSGGTLEVAGSTGSASNTTVLSGGTIFLLSNGSATGTVLSSGATLAIGRGTTLSSYVVSSGITVALGGTISNTTVSSGGTLVLLRTAGTPGSITVQPGGTVEIGSGYTLTSQAVSSGRALEVASGGILSNTLISSGGDLVVNGGLALGAIISAGGSASVANGGSLWVFAGTTVRAVSVSSGGTLAVSSGGTASNTIVLSGGTIELFGGAVTSGTTISLGGILELGAGNTQTNYTVNSGFTLEVASNGKASNTTVSSGGTLELLGGAITSGTTTINPGGILEAGSGYTETNYTVSSGRTLEIASGGTASSTTVSSGGQLIVAGTATGVTALSGGVLVASGGTLNVLSGHTVSGATVSSGGTLVVSAGATAANPTISAGGKLNILGTVSGANVSSASVAGVTISSGGTLDVLSGQIAQGEFVWTSAGVLTSGTLNVLSAGNLVVSSGATVSNALVSSGGHLTVDGTVIGAIVVAGGSAVVSSGGILDLNSNGSQLNGVTIVNNGGTLIVANLAHTSAVTISSGGTLDIWGAIVSGATISSGANAVISSYGVLDVSAGQTVNGVTLAGGGSLLVVSSGGIASGTTVSSGGTLELLSGATASNTTIKPGGALEIGAGYTQNNYIVSSGIILEVGSAGTVSSTVVSSGGTLELLSGATANSTTYSSGSFLEIASGYSMSTYATSGAVTLEVGYGGSVSSATINSGTTLDVLYGGTVSSALVSSGGNLAIDGTVSGATVSSGGSVSVGAWGTLDVASGQTVRNVSVGSGGAMVVSSGGVASATTVSGGQITVYGTVSGADVSSGGTVNVSSGGTVNGITISGGKLELASGSIAGGSPIVFTSGGTLKLDSSVSFGGTISGFALPDDLDLADIAYGSGTTLSFTEAGSNLSGTLAVSDGVHTAQLTLLGHYVTSQFTLASDGNGGTLIGDPPVSSNPAGDSPVSSNPAGDPLSSPDSAGDPPNPNSAGNPSSNPNSADDPPNKPNGDRSDANGVHRPHDWFGSEKDPEHWKSTTVSSGDVLDVQSGQAVRRVTVASGGTMNVLSNGTAIATTIANGGTEYVSSGGSDMWASVLSGGTIGVLAGATDRGTIVRSGGYEFVASGGTENGIKIKGGTVELASESIAGASPIRFTGGGTLDLDSSVTFGGKISGFGRPDTLDLKDIAYGSSTSLSFTEAKDNLSGTLTVTDGAHTAELTLLGQYTTSQFTLASDSNGGTLIGDPRTKGNSPGDLPSEPNPTGGNVHDPHDWFAWGDDAKQWDDMTAGGIKIDSDLSKLVNAMAAYDPENPGFNPGAVAQMPDAQTLHSQIAASIHG
jgi:autotransporter passenger strand-loop-strand repeat protein/YD repeat-containing protein